jgi:hypothetical protein
MRLIKICSLLLAFTLFTACASKYNKINPESLNYTSKSDEKNIVLEYKYIQLEKKYLKKELKNGVKLVGVKIKNNSEKDIVLGSDYKFIYDNGNEVLLLDKDFTFKTLKQSPASYLWYLLLSPAQLYSGTKTTQNGPFTVTEPQSVFPIGLILGPGLAIGNIVAASDANKNFKNDLYNFDLTGKSIKKGETVYGIIGISTNQYESIKIKTLN